MGGSGTADPVGSYPVKTNAVAGFNGAGMTSAQVMDILRRLDPAAVTDAGTAHTQLGAVLDQVAGRLTQHANVLAGSWSGSAAQAAMGKFQQLHDQMTLLSQQATQVGSVLTWLGTQVLPWAKALPDPAAGNVSISGDVTKGAKTGAEIGGLGAGGLGLIAGAAVGGVAGAVTGVASTLFGGGHQAADVQARQYIRALSEYLVQANDNLPGTIGVPAPGRGPGAGGSGSGDRSRSAAAAGGPAAGGSSAAAGGSPAAGGASAGGPGGATGGQHSGAGPGLASGRSGSSLDGSGGPGLPVSSGTASASADPGSARVPGPAPVSSLQGVPSPVGPGAPSAALPGSAAASVTGVDGVGSAAGTGMTGGAPVLPGLPSSPSSSPGSGGGGPARTQDGGQTATGFPMGGGGGAAAERERRRYAWMYEDEDVWGADGTDCVPPVIYGHDWRGPRA